MSAEKVIASRSSPSDLPRFRVPTRGVFGPSARVPGLTQRGSTTITLTADVVYVPGDRVLRDAEAHRLRLRSDKSGGAGRSVTIRGYQILSGVDSSCQFLSGADSFCQVLIVPVSSCQLLSMPVGTCIADNGVR